MATSKYLTAPGAFDSSPSVSIHHMAKGQRELKLWILSRGVHGMPMNCEVEDVYPECQQKVVGAHHFGCKGASFGLKVANPFMKFSRDIVCLLAI